MSREIGSFFCKHEQISHFFARVFIQFLYGGDFLSENRKRFFYNGIMLSCVALAIRGVGMVLSAYITRTVGEEGVGLYTLIMSVYSFGITFASSGISLSVTRLVAENVSREDSGGCRRVLLGALFYALIFSVTASLVLFFLSDYFALRVLADPRCALPLRILSLSLIPIALSSLFSGYFVGVRRVVPNAVGQIVGQIAKVSLTVFLIVSTKGGGIASAVVALALSTTLTELVCFLVALLQFLLDRRRHRRRGEMSGVGFNEVCRMALPLALSAYIRSALLTLEHILIPRRLRDRGESHSDSLSAYGILHGMALPLLIYPMSPLSSFASLLVPEFAASSAASDRARLKRMADEALNTTLIYASICAVAIFSFSEELGYVIYNSHGAGRYIRMLAPVVPIMYLDHTADSMLKGIGEQVYSMWVNIADSVLSIVLVFVLIPIFGISGYAAVIVIMEACNFLMSKGRLRKRVPYRIDYIRSLFLPTAIAAFSAAASNMLIARVGACASTLSLVSRLVIYLCTFFIIYYPIKGIKKHERLAL